MNKQQFAARLARSAGVSRPAAADQLDRVVHDILQGLRRGEQVRLPGLGTFLPGKKPAFRFESQGGGKGPRSGTR